MPAKDNVILLSDTETKLIRKDVDNLVQNIKDNLKLNYEAVSFEKGGGGKSLPSMEYPTVPDLQTSSRKAKSYLSSRGGSRASPYPVAACTYPVKSGGRSWAARKRYPSMSANQNLDLDNPLEMLHELISEGNLLKEAVRRLQLGLTPKIQRNFYDSDDDCRTPPAPTFNDLCQVGFN